MSEKHEIDLLFEKIDSDLKSEKIRTFYSLLEGEEHALTQEEALEEWLNNFPSCAYTGA
jgi:uncharacterized protein YgfB (UPF0149 family)